MEWRNVVSSLTLLSLPATTEAQATITFDAAGLSAYVWRGVTLTNRFVVQPDGYTTLPVGRGVFVVGGWTSIETGQYDDPVDDLSEGGGTSSFDATEVNLWAEYGHPLGRAFSATAGGLLYLYPNKAGLTNEANQTVEFYGKLQASAMLLAPKLSLWYDVGKVKGAYAEVAVAQTVNAVPAFPVTFGAVAGINLGQGINDADSTEIANFADDGLTHIDLSVVGAFRIGPVTAGPALHVVLLNDDFTQLTKPENHQDVKAWGGVTLTWSRVFAAP